MNSITSVELNLLVFRYLQDSGFTHSAFSFGHEANIPKCPIDGNLVPPGALVILVQKGLQYIEMEANLSNDDSDVDEDFSFLQPLDLITKNVNELQHIIEEKRKEKRKDRGKELDAEHGGAYGGLKNREKYERQKEHKKNKERTEKDKPRDKQHNDPNERKIVTDHQEKENIDQEKNETSEGPEPMDISTNSASHTRDSAPDVMILEGHSNEVCCCAWSPSGSILASGSGDSTARIWTIADGTNWKTFGNGPSKVITLHHVKGKTHEKCNDVTALDWNVDGSLLATGSYDGQARIWSTDGELKSILSKHKGPIFSLKWNKRGDYLLSGSCDKSAVVWDVKSGELKQNFEFHGGPTLDIDWRNNISFATSSTDHMIFVCRIGETQPIKSFSGHQGEVNCVKWDPTGTLLASCSDDMTAKIWSMKQEKYVHDLRGHSKDVYTMRWSPSGPGTANPNLPSVLASASFDSTVKLWDVEQGKLLCSLNGHRDAVYSIAFSPSAEYLVSGSIDKSMHIWSLKEGKIIRSFTGNGGIFEVCWNKEGDKIAAGFSDNRLCVLDFRK